MTIRSEKHLNKIKKDFDWVERISTLLDNKYHAFGFRFGLDPLLNFIPILGQFLTFSTSILLVIMMFRNGISSKAAVKMMLNVITDAILGSIPLLGNVIDFIFKANHRNIKLLKEYYYEDKHQGSAQGILSIIFFILILLCSAIFYFLWLIGSWVIELF